MRRFWTAACLLCLVCLLALPVFAATGISDLESSTDVAADGTCQVALTVDLRLEQAADSLTFPIPLDASDVTLNGGKVSAQRDGSVRRIDLSEALRGVTGDVSLQIRYTLSQALQSSKDDQMLLTLPLLSGFAYPIEQMRFTVTLPGPFTGQPAFTSGYHPNGAEEDLDISVTESAVSGATRTALKDHETLTMTLTLPRSLFPKPATQARRFHYLDAGMLLCALAALIYWLVFLRTGPIRPRRMVTPPEGYAAGRMGTILQFSGTDLTLMALSWAQLGYILIQIDRNGRVLLHKRMDMGSERGPLERQCFRRLFGKRRMVDTSSLAYARLSQKVAGEAPNVPELLSRRSGSRRLFRIFAAGTGLFAGLYLGRAIAGGGSARYALAVLLGLVGAVAAWQIQGWSQSLFSHRKRRLFFALASCAAYLVMGAAAGATPVALGVMVWQLAAGLLASFGGRRTETGRQAAGQVMGLRKYLKTASREELRRIRQRDPAYFFTLAPYALALDVDRAFAKRFGSERLPGCPYLTTGMDRHMTALEWSRLIRQAVKLMDARRGRLPLERARNVLHSVTRP